MRLSCGHMRDPIALISRKYACITKDTNISTRFHTLEFAQDRLTHSLVIMRGSFEEISRGELVEFAKIQINNTFWLNVYPASQA